MENVLLAKLGPFRVKSTLLSARNAHRASTHRLQLQSVIIVGLGHTLTRPYIQTLGLARAHCAQKELIQSTAVTRSAAPLPVSSAARDHTNPALVGPHALNALSVRCKSISGPRTVALRCAAVHARIAVSPSPLLPQKPVPRRWLQPMPRPQPRPQHPQPRKHRLRQLLPSLPPPVLSPPPLPLRVPPPSACRRLKLRPKLLASPQGRHKRLRQPLPPPLPLPPPTPKVSASAVNVEAAKPQRPPP